MTRTFLTLLVAWVALMLPQAAGAQAVFDVTRYGAKGDGVADDAAAIQRAVDDCSAQGGGRVWFPPGRTFIAGPVQLKAHIELYLDFGAVLKANPDEAVYRLSAFGDNEGEGMLWLWARDAEGIAVRGHGAIDGNGVAFMGRELADSYDLKPVTAFDPRPHVLTLFGCRDVSIRDITIREGAYWTLHLVGCDDVVIDGVNLLNNLKIRNGDGIDIDHSRNVRVANCHITSGDDCICLKNRREYAQYGPCRDITVTNCVMTSRSCAVKIGSENMDSICNVTIDNCVITASNRGLGIQNRDEGTVSHVAFSNILMDLRLWSDVWWGKAEPIYVTSYPRRDGNHKDANWRFPKGQAHGSCGPVSDIFFSNIMATSENGCFVGGDEPGKVSRVFFDNVRLCLRRVTAYRNDVVDRRPCRGDEFIPNEGKAVVAENVTDSRLDVEVSTLPIHPIDKIP